MPLILLSGGAPAPSLTPAVTPPGPGYFTTFFPSYFTPYFPGSGEGFGPAAAPAPTDCPPGFFTGFFPSFFTEFWPGAGGVITPPAVPTPTLPGTFVAAVRRLLMADATLTGLMAGGWWHRYAPRGTPMPAGIFVVEDDKRINSSYGSFIEDGRFRLTVYATRDLAARTAANRAVDLLTDKSLAWNLYAGRLMYFSLNSPLSSDKPMPGYGGSKVYAAERVLDFVYQGREAQA